VEAQFIKIPRDFYELHRFVTLAADVMFVNGIPFLTTRSRDIKFRTIEWLSSCLAKRLGSCLKNVIRDYGAGAGGFVVCLILMDMEFEHVVIISEE